MFSNKYIRTIKKENAKTQSLIIWTGSAFVSNLLVKEGEFYSSESIGVDMNAG